MLKKKIIMSNIKILFLRNDIIISIMTNKILHIIQFYELMLMHDVINHKMLDCYCF